MGEVKSRCGFSRIQMRPWIGRREREGNKKKKKMKKRRKFNDLFKVFIFNFCVTIFMIVEIEIEKQKT